MSYKGTNWNTGRLGAWSILFRLKYGRSGKTEVIKVKSHLEDVGPSAIQQDKIAFHHMLANSLADVVAEEAAKRLLPDMTFHQKAERAERTGVSRLGLLETAVVSTMSSFEKLVGEIANTSHLLVRHRSDLRCQACNIYRACRQFKFWANTLRS